MQIWPLSQDGAAADMRPMLSPQSDLQIRDLTALPRFGLKGPGTAEWFSAQGFDLPQVNRRAQQKGMIVLRLGTRDIMVLADPDASDSVTKLWSDWQAAPQGYSSWREEAWAWLRLTGTAAPEVMSRLTAFDFRETVFQTHAIAQTRVAHMDMVLLRDETGFDLLFDIASTAQVMHDIDIARTAEQRT